MFRGRAVDNQCYMIGTSDARDEQAGYVSWGHSLVVSPWGDVVAQMDEKPGIQITEIDLDAWMRSANSYHYYPHGERICMN